MSSVPGTLPPGFPGGVYAGPASFQGAPPMNRPVYVQGPGYGAPQATRPAPPQGWTGAPEMPQPKFRAQAPEEPPPPPRRLSLPAPEELGVLPPAARASTSASLDWNATRARLERLGALSFRVDKLADGNHRVTFLLPTPQPGRMRHIETTASNEAAAVQLALAEAEK